MGGHSPGLFPAGLPSVNRLLSVRACADASWSQAQYSNNSISCTDSSCQPWLHLDDAQVDQITVSSLLFRAAASTALGPPTVSSALGVWSCHWIGWSMGCWYPGNAVTLGANLLPGLEARVFSPVWSAQDRSGWEPCGLLPWVETDC